MIKTRTQKVYTTHDGKDFLTAIAAVNHEFITQASSRIEMSEGDKDFLLDNIETLAELLDDRRRFLDEYS